MDFDILEIRPRWMHEYANDPDVEIVVRGLHQFQWHNWLYQPDPIDARKNVMLVSTNNWPWCRFASIDSEPQGNPTYHGNAGGEFHIADRQNNPTGEVFKSRTGWSSREGVVNTMYRHLIPSELAGCIVYNAEDKSKYRVGMAGYYISADYLKEHPLFPKDLHLVRQLKFADKEVYWTISTSPDAITKPEA